MVEIRFTIHKKLDRLILDVVKELGVDKSDYAKSLIIKDLRIKET